MKYDRNTPLSVIVLYILLIIPFFVYIPISYFNNDIFLITLDAFLLFGLLFTITNNNAINNIFSNNVSIKILIFIYVLNVLIIFSTNITTADLESIKVVRNLLFGIVIFALSSAWMTTQRRVDTVIKILFYCVMFASLYGYRQLLFGFMPFELDRLAMKGASISEMEFMGRMRIASSFGDPLLFGFYMMVGVYILYLARSRKIAYAFTHYMYPFSFIIILGALILTLTRAPLAGMICGLVLYYFLIFKLNKKHIVYCVKYFIILGIFMLVLNTTSNKIGSYELNETFEHMKNGIDSLFSLYQMVSGVGDSDSNFLASQSKDARLFAWQSGLDFIYSNPLGGGLSDTSHYAFSTIDVGLLSVGLKIGIFGMTAIFLIFILIGIYSLNYVRRIPHKSARYDGYIFVSLWFSFVVTLGISDLFSSSAASVVIWTIAGILVNQKQIYSSRIVNDNTGGPSFIRSP